MASKKPLVPNANFTVPLANSADYPKPLFLPLPSSPNKGFIKGRPTPSGVGKILTTTHARYALALIAKAELSPGDTVLLPAYHCPALVEPFIWSGCKISFYNMRYDLQPDENDFATKLPIAQAAVLVRYFGFDANIKSLVHQARHAGCKVIEDLAHAAFIDELHGDYAVTSLRKFYPIDIGAEIYIKEGKDSSLIERKLNEYRKTAVLSALKRLTLKLQNKIGKKLSLHFHETPSYRYFNDMELGRPLGNIYRKETGNDSSRKIIECRRRNFSTINKLLKKSKLGTPLFPELENNTTPYVYPFLLRRKEYFDMIRSAGIPLFRWEELAPTECKVSKEFRSKLIQVPCHQDLTESNLETIANALDSDTIIKNV